MLEINEKNIKDYQQNGFVISESKLSENLFNKISKSYDEFISTNNDLTLEEMASPHLIGGTNKKHKVNEELSKSFLDIGTETSDEQIAPTSLFASGIFSRISQNSFA